MSLRRNRLWLVLLGLALATAPLMGRGESTDEKDAASRLSGEIPGRQIGPAAFGGRIADLEAVASAPNTIYVGTASGGIFRTRNNGVTWSSIFDEASSLLSIGDLAIAPSDPNIIWAGAGEPNNRQSSSWGNGVYRSLDGGDSWQLMGLPETHHIGRIQIHPSNPDVVFVAAVGHLWGANPERGVYRTQDGGKSWSQILKINSDTGAVDLAVEEGGRILYAAAYQRRRRAWGFVGGGPHSALYRSLDGGDTWQRLTEGLPTGDTGRIGISIAASKPNIVYAVIENKNGGVFRSEDRGSTWKRVNTINPRPMYYSQIRVDPNNPEKVWMLSGALYVSIDGGKTFASKGTAEKIHVDHHALWINPSDSDHLILGNDGGLYFSYDASRNWDFIDNLPIGQYYAIGVDRRDPYWVYGGTQDNGTWALPSRTHSLLGISNLDVVNIAYGDGFYAAVHPEDPRVIYSESQNGRLYRVDLDTREEKGIRPVPENSDEEYRFNWSSPLMISPHDPDVLYYGANKLFRSVDRGHSWSEISPDLTQNQDWKKLPVMETVRDDDTLSRDDGIDSYGTLTTLSESPLQAGLIYAGTDDGQVQMTRDGGQNWSNLTARFGLPGDRWVSRVLASSHQPGVAYVSFDGHQDDDFAPYIFRSVDYGQSWNSVVGNLPDGVVVNALAEHQRNPQLLFAGTESGLFVTQDGGQNWRHLRDSVPPAPIDDLIIKQPENDLVIGTHGRSIIILDDLAFLERPVAGSPLQLWPLRTATQAYEKRDLPVPGASEFSGPNPEPGALITYHLAMDPPEPEKDETAEGESAAPEDASMESAPARVEIRIEDAAGKLVRELTGPWQRGFQRVSWDLRLPLSYQAGEDDQGWFGPVRGPFVLPGAYTVKIRAGDQEASQTVQVRVDPLSLTTDVALQQRYELSVKVNQLLGIYVQAAETVDSIEKELKRIDETLKKETLPEALSANRSRLGEKMKGLKEDFKPGWRSQKFKFVDLLGQLQASFSPPTDSQVRSARHLAAWLTEHVAQVNHVANTEFPDFVEQLAEAGVGSVEFQEIVVPGS